MLLVKIYTQNSIPTSQTQICLIPQWTVLLRSQRIGIRTCEPKLIGLTTLVQLSGSSRSFINVVLSNPSEQGTKLQRCHNTKCNSSKGKMHFSSPIFGTLNNLVPKILVQTHFILVILYFWSTLSLKFYANTFHPHIFIKLINSGQSNDY